MATNKKSPAKVPTTAEHITLEQAKSLSAGTILNIRAFATDEFISNTDGTPARYKVTSVKTWKRQPQRVEIRVQWGLKTFYRLTHNNLEIIYIQK